MQGTIAQVVSLTVYGNAFLSGRDIRNFYPSNTTFKFCEYVRFVDLKRKQQIWEESPYATDPIGWLSRVQNEGACALRMIYKASEGASLGASVSDRMLVGFVGGGGRWLVEVQKKTGCDYWEGGWKVGDKDREDQLIWQVKYGRIVANQPRMRLDLPDSLALKERLASNLKEISAFARAQKLEGFAEAFVTGLAALSSDRPLASVYHGDIAPYDFLPLHAAQLLAASQAAWVFGGMGSWNDLGFDGDDQSTYDRLSEDLYRLVNTAIVVAANSTAPTQANIVRRPWWKPWG